MSKQKTITTRVAYQVQQRVNDKWAYRGEWLSRSDAEECYRNVYGASTEFRIAKVTYKQTHEDATPPS